MTKRETIKDILENGLFNRNDDLFIKNEWLDSKGQLIFNLPNRIEGDLVCNQEMTTLKGCSEYVGGNFECIGSLITNLIGGPKHVERNYNCSRCNKLESISGIANYIGGCLHTSHAVYKKNKYRPPGLQGGWLNN